MLHGIPAEFLRINKITQNFRTAFSLVLLEMLLKREKNCACGKNIFFPPFFIPLLSPVRGTESANACRLILMGRAHNTKAAHFTLLQHNKRLS